MSETLRKHIFSGLGISILVGVLLAILAPYNTGQVPFLPRLAYWVILCFFGGLGAAIFLPVAKALGFRPNRVFEILGQSITSSILVTAMLGAWNSYHTNHLDLSEVAYLFFFVWIIGITITTIIHLAERATDSNLIPQQQTPDIYDRLKPKFRNADIYALTAEDHYVRVITSKGEDLILMRLSDAVKEMAPLPGLTTHRSWWVAEAGVKSIKKTDGKTQVEIHTDQLIPVSRSNVKSLKDAGWN